VTYSATGTACGMNKKFSMLPPAGARKPGKKIRGSAEKERWAKNKLRKKG